MSTTTLENHNTKHSSSNDGSAIRALIDQVHQAHHQKDAAAIVAAYTPDAAVFSLAPPLSHRGIDRTELQNWLDTWVGPIEMESRDLKITVSGDFAFAHGFYQLSGNKIGVPQRISFWMRATVCLERSNNAWRIIHLHESVPFYMDGSLRPAFDLEPPAAPEAAE
jgi:ketosteroid isomerase-like protein